MMNGFNITGHSNFNICLISRDDGFFVYKSSPERGMLRLKDQSRKQHAFENLISTDPVLSHFFHVPKVIAENESKDEYGFFMHYFRGDSMLSLLEQEDVRFVDLLMERIFVFVDWCFRSSVRTDVSTELFVEKLRTVKSQLPTSAKELERVIDTLVNYLSTRMNISVPIGVCHGDLTFSNMIFSHKIVFIDFLDTFLDSPLQDVAKLMQEINLKWSLLMNTSVTDKTKVSIGYTYMKRKMTERIVELCDRYLISSMDVDLFYIITLLRILPYARDPQVIVPVIREVQELCEVFK